MSCGFKHEFAVSCLFHSGPKLKTTKTSPFFPGFKYCIVEVNENAKQTKPSNISQIPFLKNALQKSISWILMKLCSQDSFGKYFVKRQLVR